MATRIYLMPVIDSVDLTFPPEGGSRRPKYKRLLAGLTWSAMDMGFEPVMLVAVRDIPGATHDALVLNSDVVAVPANLGATIGVNLPQVQAALETFNIPSGWVGAAMTYGQVSRIIACVFQFFQRLHHVCGNVRLFASGVTLGTRVKSLPSGVQTALRDTAVSLNYDLSAFGGNPTLRAAIKAMADQWPAARALRLGEVEL